MSAVIDVIEAYNYEGAVNVQVEITSDVLLPNAKVFLNINMSNVYSVLDLESSNKLMDITESMPYERRSGKYVYFFILKFTGTLGHIPSPTIPDSVLYGGLTNDNTTNELDSNLILESTCDSSVKIGQAVRIDSSSGYPIAVLVKPSLNTSATGIVSAKPTKTSCKIMLSGFLKIPTRAVTGPLFIGQDSYPTPILPPNGYTVQQIGYAYSPEIMMVQIQQALKLA